MASRGERMISRRPSSVTVPASMADRRRRWRGLPRCARRPSARRSRGSRRARSVEARRREDAARVSSFGTVEGSTSRSGGEVRSGNFSSSERLTMRATISSTVVSAKSSVASVAPVAQHGDAVDDLRHLVETVRDVDDADAGSLQVVDHLEQQSRLLLGERGGRLVHDEHFGVQRQRLGDLHHLALRRPSSSRTMPIRIDGDAEPVEAGFLRSPRSALRSTKKPRRGSRAR